MRPSSREESVDKEEKEENGTERKRFSPFHQFYIYLKNRFFVLFSFTFIVNVFQSGGGD